MNSDTTTKQNDTSKTLEIWSRYVVTNKNTGYLELRYAPQEPRLRKD